MATDSSNALRTARPLAKSAPRLSCIRVSTPEPAFDASNGYVKYERDANAGLDVVCLQDEQHVGFMSMVEAIMKQAQRHLERTHLLYRPRASRRRALEGNAQRAGTGAHQIHRPVDQDPCLVREWSELAAPPAPVGGVRRLVGEESVPSGIDARTFDVDGRDVIYGSPGRNELDGGPGADEMYGGSGRNAIRGGAGDDGPGGGAGGRGGPPAASAPPVSP